MAEFWTPERDAQLLEMNGRGCSYNEIARVMGVFQGSISNRLTGLGITREPYNPANPDEFAKARERLSRYG